MRHLPPFPTRFESPAADERRRNGPRLAMLSLVGLAFGVLANQARAQNQYFDVNGTTSGYGIVNGGTYSWDAANWGVSGGTGATTTWGAGTFARFYGGVSGNSYTVTVGQDELMAGLYMNSSGVTLTINQAAGTSGDLNVAPASPINYQGFLVGTSTTAGAVIINAPIVGTGGVEQESYGSLSLYGVNTYSGGTETTGGQTLNYNNNSSFGTGAVTLTNTGGQGISNSGPSGLVIANNFIFGTAGSSTNFVGGSATAGGAAGTNFTGTFTLAATGTALINTSNSATTVDEISGVISGASSINIADLGTMILAGANTYTGTTTVSGTATLKLGAANTIASSTSLVLNGGTLNPDGLNQNMSATTLGLTASSKIDFGVGASTLDFANSSALTWTSGTVLNLVNYNAGLDALQFGTDATGLSAAELSHIEFNGAGLGTAALNSNGFLVVASASAAPEPSSWALIGAGALGGLAFVRRRARKP